MVEGNIDAFQGDSMKSENSVSNLAVSVGDVEPISPVRDSSDEKSFLSNGSLGRHFNLLNLHTPVAEDGKSQHHLLSGSGAGLTSLVHHLRLSSTGRVRSEGSCGPLHRDIQ